MPVNRCPQHESNPEPILIALRQTGIGLALGVAPTLLILASIMQPVALAQAQSKIPVLGVCDVLRGLDGWRGKNVVIVGLAEYTFDGTFLGDQCEPDGRVLLQGHKWVSLVAVARNNTHDQARVEFPVSDEILQQKAHALGMPTESGVGRVGPAHDASASPTQQPLMNLGPRWIAVYGQLESPVRLVAHQPPAGPRGTNVAGNGYGANGSVAAQICVVADRDLRVRP